MSQVFIGLGSNLEEPEQQLKQAIHALANTKNCKLIHTSPFYLTKPVGYLNQPDFINAVVEIDTSLSPKELLKEIQHIEQQHGRVRTFQNAPRTLDLDILAFDQLRYQDDELTIPHPRMHNRAFVLIPFNDIAGDFELPGLGKVNDLALQCQGDGMVKINGVHG
ncbi:MAG: 2-amino-4-hydroxy-6-hydroxymethyldihydropteridine diphosphokinase [Betaproteobacteria bacterium]|nr:2-amino-4-hydroxy-6-hydroxymethyldihydropteridine diphosphokinase [Betaproteobacteria bacterium]